MAMTQPPSGKCSRPFTSHDTPQTVSYTLSHACDHHLAKAGNCRGMRIVVSTATIEQSAVNTYKKTLKVRERRNSIGAQGYSLHGKQSIGSRGLAIDTPCPMRERSPGSTPAMN